VSLTEPLSASVTSNGSPPIIGEVWVPKDTPVGPREARTAWAHALHTALQIVRSVEGGETEVFVRGVPDAPYRMVLMPGAVWMRLSDLYAKYERA
jgi:hypothetical protein